MTGRELIRLQATLHGLPRKSGEEKAEVLLDRVGLERAADRRVGTYSGGMRRRLDLASALVHEPEVLFLDEPTTGLDPVSRKAIWEEVAKLNAEGTTVFLTTQYLEEADQLAEPGRDHRRRAHRGRGHARLPEGGDRQRAPGGGTRGRQRRGGRARSCPRFGKVLPRKDGRVLVELTGGAADVAKVVRALDEAGIIVEGLDLIEPTLDDVFVEKTGYHLEGDDEGERRRTSACRPSQSGIRRTSRHDRSPAPEPPRHLGAGAPLGPPDLPPSAADGPDHRLSHAAARDPDRRRRRRGQPARASPRSTVSSTSCSPGR